MSTSSPSRLASEISWSCSLGWAVEGAEPVAQAGISPTTSTMANLRTALLDTRLAKLVCRCTLTSGSQGIDVVRGRFRNRSILTVLGLARSSDLRRRRRGMHRHAQEGVFRQEADRLSGFVQERTHVGWPQAFRFHRSHHGLQKLVLDGRQRHTGVDSGLLACYVLPQVF